MNNYDLSICIPSYNRASQLQALLAKLFRIPGAFEVCVHDDGSTDQTPDVLRGFADPRLSVSASINRGRGPSVFTLVQRARGRYLMIFDDDDEICEDGVVAVLEDCKKELSHDIVGFIYHMDAPATGPGHAGEDLEFPVDVTNFLALRADHLISGDKKEVILTAIMQNIADPLWQRFRRVPSSLYWSRIALEYDVLCRNQTIGFKNYLPDGMTSVVGSLKLQNPHPQFLVHKARLAGLFRGRYTSLGFASRAMVGLIIYGSLDVFQKISSRRQA